MKKLLRLLVPILVIGIGLAAAYYLWSRRVERKAAELPPPAEGPGQAATGEEAAEEQKARLERTLRTMEETRRLNEARPGAVAPPNPNPAADLQRTFKTIEEINRLNRLNREMREKQQPTNRP